MVVGGGEGAEGTVLVAAGEGEWCTWSQPRQARSLR